MEYSYSLFYSAGVTCAITSWTLFKMYRGLRLAKRQTSRAD